MEVEFTLGCVRVLEWQDEIPAPSATFYTDMSQLVESLVKNGSGNANQGYRRLRFFSGQLKTWMSQAIQAIEEWGV